MTHAATSVLNSQITLEAASSVNLLVVADSQIDILNIIDVLKETGVSFTYEYFDRDSKELSLSDRVYDAILFSFNASICSSQNRNSLFGQLSWWYESQQQIPLILITDPLGDELAVECIQSGINGYILKTQIFKLPLILGRVLVNCNRNNQETILAKPGEINSESQLDRTTFLSYFIHDLRSPVANIISFSKALLDQIYGSLNQKQIQYIELIGKSGEDLLELVNDFLDLSKIDAEKEVIYPQKLTVKDICDASIVVVKERAKEQSLDLILDIDDRVDYCLADKNSLKRILVNLLSNAIKFTEVGSVTLQVKVNSKTIDFSTIDTGIGIAKSEQSKLFQPFQQLSGARNCKHKGTGLGLALSRQLARLHGGDITVTSEIGKGSCFTLHLPRKIKKK